MILSEHCMAVFKSFVWDKQISEIKGKRFDKEIDDEMDCSALGPIGAFLYTCRFHV